MSSELAWAVTDGAAGTHAVVLPEGPAEARRLVRHYGGGFWCSRAAGGCGSRLAVSALGAGRPSFRHPPETSCAFVDRGSRAGRAYEHLRYQHALTAWLTGQGYRPRVERVLGADGGADLHVGVEDLSHALEVQLSPLSDLAWRSRDDRLRAEVQQVTWLHGPGAETTAATEAAVRGVSLAVRRQGTGLSVGVRDVDDRTRWVLLGACRLTADGFSAPGTDEARELHARRTAERRETAQRVARQAARRASTGSRALPGHGRRSPAEEPWNSLLTPLPFPG
ncbi:hypothetical protein ACI782_02125 [Geodermatophilus sp. SYSU D00703]